MIDIIILLIALSIVTAVVVASERYQISFIWQTPAMYRCSGLWLKVGNKKYWIWKVGV